MIWWKKTASRKLLGTAGRREGAGNGEKEKKNKMKIFHKYISLNFDRAQTSCGWEELEAENIRGEISK